MCDVWLLWNQGHFCLARLSLSAKVPRKGMVSHHQTLSCGFFDQGILNPVLRCPHRAINFRSNQLVIEILRCGHLRKCFVAVSFSRRATLRETKRERERERESEKTAIVPKQSIILHDVGRLVCKLWTCQKFVSWYWQQLQNRQYSAQGLRN